MPVITEFLVMTKPSRVRKCGRRPLVAFAMNLSGSPKERPMPRAILGAIEWGRQHGWEMLDLSHWQLRIPSGRQPDGLITYLGEPDREQARKLHAATPNSVYIDSWFLAGKIPGVQVDEYAVGRKAAEYLLARGYRNAAISGFRRTRSAPNTLAFRDRMREAGASCTRIPSLSANPIDLKQKGAFFKERLAKLTLPLAIFCTNDRLAVRICHWCLEAGLEVPEQVAILGAGNDILACECSPVSISSVDLQCEHRGAEAAHLLQQMMNGTPTAPTAPLLIPPGEVVTRRSTEIVAVQDLAAARALRYIWDHYEQNIGATDVARFCGISRRTLDRHMVASIGRTTNEEFLHQRLLKACELLSSTEIPVADIAAIAGFHSAQYFNLRFTRAFNITPRRYRERERVRCVQKRTAHAN